MKIKPLLNLPFCGSRPVRHFSTTIDHDRYFIHDTTSWIYIKKLGMGLATRLKIANYLLMYHNPQAWRGPVWKFIAFEVRSSSPSSSQSNEQARNLQLLENYLMYMQSSREHRELLARYQGRGERSVEESAHLVGLELPNQSTAWKHASKLQRTTPHPNNNIIIQSSFVLFLWAPYHVHVLLYTQAQVCYHNFNEWGHVFIIINEGIDSDTSYNNNDWSSKAEWGELLILCCYY